MGESPARLGVTLCVQLGRLAGSEHDVLPVERRHVIAARIAIVGSIKKRFGNSGHAARATADDRELIIVVKIDLLMG